MPVLARAFPAKVTQLGSCLRAPVARSLRTRCLPKSFDHLCQVLERKKKFEEAEFGKLHHQPPTPTGEFLSVLNGMATKFEEVSGKEKSHCSARSPRAS